MKNQEVTRHRAQGETPGRGLRTRPLTPHSALCTPHSERGVALVITLLLLSVITFMAITFLVVSRSEHGSVAVTTDSTIARLAADTARDRAIAEVLAPILNATNPYNYGLLVSTNYINTNGFGATTVADDLLNVNYDYTASGAPLNLNQQLQNLQNLFFNPRPPVFVVTNALAVRSNEFRFYLDLNRNGMFDPTGFMPLTNALNQQILGSLAYMVGDPQWIGILQRPELFHSPTNLFASRYAYAVVPMGQGLDINTMGNYAKAAPPGNLTPPPNPGAAWLDGFLRNQGVMTAELNLAGFLVDLNTNLWPYPDNGPYGFTPYAYFADLITPNRGAAFDDAVTLLRYRYGTNINNLASVQNLFPVVGPKAFRNDFMDGYCGGPLMTNTWWPSTPLDEDGLRVGKPWPGARNPNRFLTTQDFFDRTKTTQPVGGKNPYFFPDRLKLAGTNVDSYNRYTFNRLLSQLGTESDPEPQNKMNLNYCNVDSNGRVVPNAATNFQAWTAAQFFTNAAIRLMVDAGYTVGASTSTSNLLVTNLVTGVWATNIQIMIWPTNYYTPSLHRLFQLAANLYESTTNRVDGTYAASPAYPYLPTIFRPLFLERGPNASGQRQVLVNGYAELGGVFGRGPNPFTGSTTPHDLSDGDDLRRLGTVQPTDMVYNVPLVIGAKKGLPNFDEYTSDTQIQVARKLIYHRPGTSITAPVNEIDPAYYVTVTNVLGLQAWNSYAAAYNRPLTLFVWPDTSVLLTNTLNPGNYVQVNPVSPLYPSRQPQSSPVPLPVHTPWSGYNAQFPGSSFQVPYGPQGSALVFMPSNSVYSFSQQKFLINGQYDRTPGSTNHAVPRIQLTLKARLRFALVDTSVTPSRLIDYVNVAANQTIDLNTELVRDGPCGTAYSAVYSRPGMWCTNLPVGTVPRGVDPNNTFGVRLQIDTSSGLINSPDWTSSLPDPIYGRDRDKGINRFLFQFGLGTGAAGAGEPVFQTLNAFATPFSPFRTIHLVTVWQANDPLVHYTMGDLQNLRDFPQSTYLDQATPPVPPTAFGTVNRRYEPWGGNPTGGSTSATKYEWRVKDPVGQQFGSSDAWDFPTNKFPNPGWVGRVHRGSPWQTAYLKSPSIGYSNWIVWSGNNILVTNYGQLPVNMPQWIVATNTAVTPPVLYQWTYDSAFSLPTNDWRLVDVFSTAFDPNTTRGRLSINQTNLAAWSAVLSGVIALTNSGTSGRDANGNYIPTAMVIPPAGVYDPDPALSNTWPAIVKIVNGINAARANTNNPNLAPFLPVFPNQVFHRLGDILAVPQLTSVSPFLSIPAANTQPPIPFNDAAMERLPQQILGLLKCDETPRVAIYAWGQTLKPAVHSRMTSGPFFGLVTNYQIAAEVATRTVVRFDGVPPYQYGVGQTFTNLHPVIESFTILPPD